MKNPNFKKENIEQAKALAIISSKTHKDVLELITEFGAEFRAIINDFEAEFGAVPTANDLIYIASVHANRDITK